MNLRVESSGRQHGRIERAVLDVGDGTRVSIRLTEHVVAIGEMAQVVVSHRANTSVRRAVYGERHMRIAAAKQCADGVRQTVGRNAVDEIHLGRRVLELVIAHLNAER